jgi:hypothetical protein
MGEFLISLSRWERVGVRAYCGVGPIDGFAFGCHSPSTEHDRENSFLSQALIPALLPKGEG